MSRPAPRWRTLRRVLLVLGALTFLEPGFLVLCLRWFDPPHTWTMVGAVRDHHDETGEWRWVHYAPVRLEELGEVPRMVVTAEDDAFFHHHGIDWGGLCVALDRNREAGHVVAGGSTITQQTAKNVFLWQGRSWLRKGLETVFVAWMELLLPKERILEVYLSVAETGPLTFGFEAGAQHWYEQRAGDLSRERAARLAGILPGPRTRTPGSAESGRKARRLMARPAVFPGEDHFEDVGEKWRARAWEQCGL